MAPEQDLPSSPRDQLSTRIMAYLEDNRSKEFIDPNHMAVTLYDLYPEYRKKLFKAHKVNVEKTFNALQDELKKKNKRRRKEKPKQEVEARAPEETPVKKSLNGRLTDLYAKPGSPKPSSPKPSSPDQDISDPDELEVLEKPSPPTPPLVEIIEDETPGTASEPTTTSQPGSQLISSPETEESKSNGDAIVQTNGGDSGNGMSESENQNKNGPAPLDMVNGNGKLDGIKAVETKSDDNLSEFDKIKMRAQKAAKNLDVEKEKKSRPSKSLSKYLESQKDPEPVSKKIRIEKPKLKDVNSPAKKVIEVDRKEAAVKTPLRTVKNKAAAAVKTPVQTVVDDSVVDLDIEEAIKSNVRSHKRTATAEKGSTAKKKRKIEVTIQESSVKFSDFGGNDALLCDICKLLAHLKHPEMYRELGVTPPRGFLLHGPPGCGKTLLAHAIVGELGLPFIKVSAPELISGVSGDSEGKIRDLFQQAEGAAPCILFIDEIDSIAPKRENAQREMERRIVAQMLTCLDELGKGEQQVVVIGATNRPDSLDPALRRAGRFDREIGLGIPDRAARLKILNVLCRNLRLGNDVDLVAVAVDTPG